MAAGSAINQLANDYANLPVLFLEEDVDDPPFDRYYRWWDSYGGDSATLPLVMVNSGHQVSNGPLDYYNTYKAMIDSELQRPAEARIEAYFRRVGDHVRVYGSLTNLSGATLWYTNSVSVGAIVYESARIHLTDRFVRTTAQLHLSSSLLPGAMVTFTLDTPNLSGVDWNQLHTLVLADYRPMGYSGAFDMLQATHVAPITFTVQPNPLVLMVDSAQSADVSFPLMMRGPYHLDWTATESISWLSLSTASGSIMAPPRVTTLRNALTPGWQTGQIEFSATSSDGLAFTQIVPVSAYYGPMQRAFLPVVMH
jgi:hypothetical protein